MARVDTIQLSDGDSLQGLLTKLSEKKVDLSKVCVRMDYIGCQADHGDSYCYCDGTYADIRLEWKI